VSALAIVLPVEHGETARPLLDSIRDEPIWAELELVLVCPSEEELALDETMVAGIGAVRIVEIGPLQGLSEARAAGVHATASDLIFVAETHAFPQPGCLAALVSAHAEGAYAAIAPIFESANPESALGWASLFLTYRYMLEPAGRDGLVSSYNCCFRREALVALGDGLPEALGSGSRMASLIGGPVRREPTARIRHLNVARVQSVVIDRMFASRVWTSFRVARWSRPRRLLAFVASPLVAPLLVLRTVRSPQWAHARPELPRWTLPALAFSALCIAAGEALAYVAGAGDASRRLISIELERERHV
jgi:hypothetical protein